MYTHEYTYCAHMCKHCITRLTINYPWIKRRRKKKEEEEEEQN